MAAGNPVFLLEELESFDVEQLRRICGYLQIAYTKKLSKKKLVTKIWDQIKPPPAPPASASNPVMTLDGIEQIVSVKLARMQAQALMTGDKPNEW